MMLINVALENEELFSTNGKTHLFMDLLGNSLLHSSSYLYLCSKSEQFIKFITDSDYAATHAQIFDFSQLKYREKDQLELTFNFWKNKKEHVYDIAKYWDDQNRCNLKERYDHRDGVFDWDLQMRLKDQGVTQICTQEYKHWRETGIAFTFPEFEQSYPNKTFAVDLRKNGDQFYHRGYIGDMAVGPFIPFGVDCSDLSMLKSKFGDNQCRSTDVTERNVFELLYELEHQKKFDCAKNFRELGSVRLQFGKNFDAQKVLDENLQLVKYDKKMKMIQNVKIIFLPVDDVLKIQKRHNFQELFDVVFVASNYLPLLKEDFPVIMKQNSLFLFETKKYSTLKKDEIKDFTQKIKDYGKATNLKPVTNFCINVLNSIIKYRK